MKRTRRPALRAAVLLLMLLSTGCRRTVRVEVPVPVAVEVDRCPITLGPLPALPHRDPEACLVAYGEFGKNAACYDPVASHRLAALLDYLIDLYTDVLACQPSMPEPPTEGVSP